MTQKKNFQPVAVLKIYRQPDSRSYYIEKHNVRFVDGEPLLGAGTPLTEDMLKRITRYISSEDRYNKPMLKKKWLTGNILSVEPNPNHFHLMWYEPAMKRKIHCTKRCPIASGEYNFPAFLYFMVENTLKIYAMKTNQRRPDPSTKLFRAPIMNGVGGGEMCWGNVDRGKETFVVEDEIARWQSKMWESQFSHEGTDNVSKIPLTEIYAIAKNQKFPVKTMIDASMTIKDLLNELR